MMLRRLAARSPGLLGLAGGAFGGWTLAHAEERPPRPSHGDHHKTPPRRVKSLEPPLLGFFSKEIDVLGLPVRSAECVSDTALVVAGDRLSRMLRHLPVAVHERLQRRGASFHIVGMSQGCSDLPEHAHMKGVDGGYTGE